MTSEALATMTGMKPAGTEKKPLARGRVLGFPAEVSTEKKCIWLYLFAKDEVTKQQKNELLQRFETSVATFNTQESSISDWQEGGVLQVAIWLNGEDPVEVYPRVLPQLETALSEVGIVPDAACPFCEKPDGNAVAHINGRLALAHLDCLQTWRDEQLERVEHNRYNQGSGRGIIGGLVGGLVGALPALAAMQFLGYFVGILFALIPIGIYYGWKLFGGRLSGLTTIFTIVYTAVVAVATDVVDSWLILRDIFPEYDITLMDTIEAYLDPELFQELFMRSTLTALFFAGIGIFVAWGQIRKTDQSDANDASAAVDEAIPL
jgi:hypothetical protein